MSRVLPAPGRSFFIGFNQFCGPIVDATGKRTDLAAGTIEELEALTTSLMPEQLLRDLTAQQAADLLAHLGSLR
jgi:hypothetical protein